MKTIRDPNWMTHLWQRVKSLFSGLDARVTALEQGGGGGSAVSGVKGDAESTYRTGNVNLTPANIGALPSSTTIPSKTSDLTNDSGYITQAQVDHLGIYIDAQGYMCQRISSDT